MSLLELLIVLILVLWFAGGGVPGYGLVAGGNLVHVLLLVVLILVIVRIVRRERL